MEIKNEKILFYEANWFIWLCMFFLPPVGIFLIWKNEKFKLLVRVILSVIGAIWFFLGIIFYSDMFGSNKDDIAKLRSINELNESQVTNQSSEIELLKTEIKELTERVSNLETENITLTTNNSNLNIDISDLESNNVLLQSENSELKKTTSESSTPTTVVTPPSTPTPSSTPAPASQAPPTQAPVEETPSSTVSAAPETNTYKGVNAPSSLNFSRNEQATVSIVAKPNTNYSITVYYKSGASTAAGLEPKMSDANGNISWSWKIGGKTSPGTFKIVISGGDESVTIPFNVS